ncbi:MAG: urease accessory protein UreD [Betaproteobacteria bacterium]|nr:urease accessory protein UreD [Betaproteobacteria bacterium]
MGPATAQAVKDEAAAGSGWRAELTLDYRRRGARTVAHDAHSGPLRVLQPLYPEGEGICHHVLVHPPGGLVGGDQLHVHARLQAGSHVLLTTPGATRFYRSEGAAALQRTRLQLDDGARLEWLPMETIAYSGCQARNHLSAELAPGAEWMGWDTLVLGLVAAGQPFIAGSYGQHIEVPGVWLERGRVDAADHVLLRSPLGWASHTVAATLWFAAGAALPPARRQALLDAARAAIDGHELAATAGVTAPQPAVLVLRLLAPRVEAAMRLLARVRAAWRQEAWGLAAEPPRIWRT